MQSDGDAIVIVGGDFEKGLHAWLAPVVRLWLSGGKAEEGDFVALLDHDNSYGRAYRQGAVTISVIVHSDCRGAGHGPGVTTVMTCSTSLIKPIIDPRANIADLFKIGTMVKAK